MVRYFPSSTKPALVGTDAGNGYLKGAQSPAGATALISELVAAELGTQMCLDIPPFAVVWAIEIDIPMLDHHGHILPPAFFSKHIEGVPSDGTDEFVKRLDDPNDLARLIVFDTWIRNGDRCFPTEAEGVYNLNRDNLLFETLGDRLYRLAPIDHSHCIVDVQFDTAELRDQALIRDENVYGFFPEFRPYISAGAVAEAVQAMLSINRAALDEIVNSVPPEWGLGAQERLDLASFFEQRADFLAQSLPMKLVEQPMLRNMP
ncbi:HipA family kinase [Mesorhizobium hawassense]|uniref:HipA family kinase n=1 Tax=Mesorhizobium hawassense TaxID=1209954 RepID=UPI0011BE25FD|nr:HipA family kinase [Mesorhizobium hawassense]